MNAKKIGDTIKTLRVGHGMTQRELASKTGIMQPVLSRFEKEPKNPKLETILELLKPFGKTLEIVDL